MDDFKEKENIDLSSDIQALQPWSCWKAKIELSTVEKTTIYHLLLLIKLPKHIEKELTRDVFEKLCEKLISRCRIPVEKL
jgi:L1 cell adhesion molecule like protein